MRYLTIALTKGRLAQKTLDIFEKVGITCEEIRDKNSRKLIFVNEELKLKFFWQRGRMYPHMWNMERPISALPERIRSWRRDEGFMRLWTWGSEPAVCVCAGRKVQRSFSIPTS